MLQGTKSSRWIRGAALLAAVVLTASCGPVAATAQAGQPAAQPVRNDADVRFMQGMIAHHAQALEMTALVPDRAVSQAVKMMAERIDVSQRDEIATLERWLRAHGAPAADSSHAHHGAGHTMPGMLSAEEMRRLAAASGAEFDRLFLELMIRHHEGALVMVAELFGSRGGGQDPEVFAIASEVDADQRMEIDRMRAMLERGS